MTAVAHVLRTGWIKFRTVRGLASRTPTNDQLMTNQGLAYMAVLVTGRHRVWFRGVIAGLGLVSAVDFGGT